MFSLALLLGLLASSTSNSRFVSQNKSVSSAACPEYCSNYGGYCVLWYLDHWTDCSRTCSYFETMEGKQCTHWTWYTPDAAPGLALSCHMVMDPPIDGPGQCMYGEWLPASLQAVRDLEDECNSIAGERSCQAKDCSTCPGTVFDPACFDVDSDPWGGEGCNACGERECRYCEKALFCAMALFSFMQSVI